MMNGIGVCRGMESIVVWVILAGSIGSCCLLSENCFLIQQFFGRKSFLSAMAVFVGWKFFVVESF